MRVIFSIILSAMLFFNTSFAVNLPFNGNAFVEAGKNSDENLIDDIDKSLSVGLVPILVLLYSVGDVVAVCIFIYFGIKVLISTPAKKAELKASLAPYFIGLLLYIAGVPIAIKIINIFITFF